MKIDVPRAMPVRHAPNDLVNVNDPPPPQACHDTTRGPTACPLRPVPRFGTRHNGGRLTGVRFLSHLFSRFLSIYLQTFVFILCVLPFISNLRLFGHFALIRPPAELFIAVPFLLFSSFTSYFLISFLPFSPIVHSISPPPLTLSKSSPSPFLFPSSPSLSSLPSLPLPLSFPLTSLILLSFSSSLHRPVS